MRSTCTACGYSLLGEVSNGHIAREYKHRESCPLEWPVANGAQRQPSHAADIVPLRVLSAGRDPLLLRIRNQVLATTGCFITSASTSMELTNRFFEADHDLIVLCHTIPPEERFKILRMVKVYRPSTRVIVVGDLADDGVPDVPINLSVQGVPSAPESLVEAVKSAFPERTSSA